MTGPTPSRHVRRTPLSTAGRALTYAAVAMAMIAGLAVHSSGTPLSAAPGDPVDWGDLDTTGLITPYGQVASPPEPFAPSTPVGDLVFTLGLKGDVAGLEAYARAVSDPSSAKYGDHRTVAELATQFGANTATIDAVTNYFATRSIELEFDPTGTFVMAFMTTAEAETVFSTGGWNQWTYPSPSAYDDNMIVYPAAAPSLPPELVGHVDKVDGLSFWYWGPPRSDDAAGPLASGSADPGDGSPFRTGTPQGCAGALDITLPNPVVPAALMPNQLNTAYQIDQLHARGSQGQGMRVAIVDDGLYDPAWLATYRACFGLEDATPVTDHVIGTPDGDPTETILDLSVMSFAAPYVDRFDVFIVDDTINDEVEDIIPGLLRMFSAPLDASQTGGLAPDVISASFAACETVPAAWNGRTAAVSIMEQVLATAAAAGISYVSSTGDSGASGCFHEYGEDAPEFISLATSYPATSEWMTAVGGTNLELAADNSILRSGVWNDNDFFPILTGQGGGGGTSIMIERPWYQAATDTGSTTMRTVPDVSLLGDPYPGYAIYAGSWSNDAGTSASTPLFGAMVLLLGQETKAAGQPRLGFLNPLLYTLGQTASSGYLDITAGNNDTIATDCCDAKVGYDTATGWGSPLAEAMTQVLAAPTVSVQGLGSTDGSHRVAFSATVNPAGGTVREYRWDVNSDGIIDHTTDGPVLSIVTQQAGPVTVSLTVVTTLGRTSVAGTSVVAADPPPPAPVPTPIPRNLAFTG